MRWIINRISYLYKAVFFSSANTTIIIPWESQQSSPFTEKFLLRVTFYYFIGLVRQDPITLIQLISKDQEINNNIYPLLSIFHLSVSQLKKQSETPKHLHKHKCTINLQWYLKELCYAKSSNQQTFYNVISIKVLLSLHLAPWSNRYMTIVWLLNIDFNNSWYFKPINVFTNQYNVI